MSSFGGAYGKTTGDYVNEAKDAIEDDEVKRLKTAAYAQKAQYQAMVKELAKAIKELAKVDSD